MPDIMTETSLKQWATTLTDDRIEYAYGLAKKAQNERWQHFADTGYRAALKRDETPDGFPSLDPVEAQPNFAFSPGSAAMHSVAPRFRIPRTLPQPDRFSAEERLRIIACDTHANLTLQPMGPHDLAKYDSLLLLNTGHGLPSAAETVSADAISR